MLKRLAKLVFSIVLAVGLDILGQAALNLTPIHWYGVLILALMACWVTDGRD